MEMKLYELTALMKEINDAIIENNDEDLIEMAKDTAKIIDKKCDSMVGYTSMLTDQLELVTKRKKEVQELEKRIKKKIDRYKEYVMMCMKYADIKKIEGPLSRITMVKPRKKLFVEEKAVPKEYLKVVTQVDNEKIRDALDAGEQLNFAGYVDGKQSVLIKWK